jgi:hypothetical protein
MERLTTRLRRKTEKKQKKKKGIKKEETMRGQWERSAKCPVALAQFNRGYQTLAG